MFKSKIRHLAALATALLVATAANADALTQSSDAPPSRTVKFGDLDLTTQQGIATLHHRIAEAAREVCPDPDTKDLGQLVHAHACRTQAIERAVRAVGNPTLAKMAASRPMLLH